MNWQPKNIEVVTEDLHRGFLREAYKYALGNSDDPATKTGAIIVSANLGEILAYGTNHFPDGLNPTKEERGDRKWKYDHIIHAEPAAIHAAARDGKATKGTVMYMPWVPCTPCAKAIIDAGIKMLIGHKETIIKTPERWWESTGYALDLLKKCGVRSCMYPGKIGEVEAMFDGEIWHP